MHVAERSSLGSPRSRLRARPGRLSRRLASRHLSGVLLGAALGGGGEALRPLPAALRHDGLAVLADLAGKGGGGVGEDVEDGEGEDGGEVDGAADGRDDAAEEVQIGIAQGGEGVGELARGIGKPLWEESKRAGASGRGQRTGREVGEGSSGRARKVG